MQAEYLKRQPVVMRILTKVSLKIDWVMLTYLKEHEELGNAKLLLG